MTAISFRMRVTHNNWDAIKDTLAAQADVVASKIALDLEAQAKTMAPVDTGTLKNSIQAMRVGAAHWRIVVGVEYGAYVNYGTRFMAAQPFWDNAWAKITPQFKAALKGLFR